MSNYLTQKERVLWVFIYGLAFIILNAFLFGSWVPSLEETGFWFYAGLASLILGRLVSTPFFTPPGDVMSYSVTALFGLISVSRWGDWLEWERALFIGVIVYACAALLCSISSILLRDTNKQWCRQLSETLQFLSMRCGSSGMIFGALIGFALIVFYRTEPSEIIWIGGAWIIIGILNPEDFFHSIGSRIQSIWSNRLLPKAIGRLHAYKDPNIFLVAQEEDQSHIATGTILAIGGENTYGVSISYVGRDSDRYLRVLDLKKILPKASQTKSKGVFRVTESASTNEHSNIVGLVDDDSDINTLIFEVTSDYSIKEGLLVEVNVNNQPVVYQIVNGITRDDIVSQKHTFGYVRASAKKIGAWDNIEQKFTPVSWVPMLNSPVKLLEMSEEKSLPIDAVGYFPGTAMPVSIKDIHSLVTHNTAILGILGVGKTKLSMELIERMIAAKIHVISIDITDEHEIELASFCTDQATVSKEIEELMQIGASGKTASKQNKEEGGSANIFKAKFKEQLSSFIKSDEHYFRVYNPATFSVWKQSGGQYQGAAAMESLTPTGVTQIISEITLELLQAEGRSNGNAKVCLIYEEAHSLVPEWSSAVMEGDKSATNGTARAILQGRKYGMGCLLITQRTANVTKTILNQCNSIFAMRTFDETGKDFLSNYIGRSFANTLPDLKERYAVFFGKASSCENPVLIRLNDQKDFQGRFRAKHPLPEPIETDEYSDLDTLDEEPPF